jgi:hypothetical protein
MTLCTDLIRQLEQYCRGYGDRSSIDRLLVVAHRNCEDSRVFAWQRERLGALIAQVEASRATDFATDTHSLLAAHRVQQARPGMTNDPTPR